MLNWTTKGRLKLAFDIGYVWNKPGALWRRSPGTCLGPKSLSSNVAAQKTFSQIGVSLACDCTKTAVKLKFSSWGHNKKLIFYKTCTLDNNGTLIELRDLKHSALGRLIFLFWRDKNDNNNKTLFIILLSQAELSPTKCQSGLHGWTCISLSKPNMTLFHFSCRAQNQTKQNGGNAHQAPSLKSWVQRTH